MATLTENLKLTKPDTDEFYNIQVQNENMDIIDEEITKAINNPTLDEILALLENTTYGLNALKNLLSTGGVDLTPVTSGLSTVNTNVSTVQSTLNNSTYGLSALNTDIDNVQSALNNSTYGLSAIKSAVNGRANEATVVATKALLENGTYGLSALNNDLDIIQNILNNGTYGLSALRNTAGQGCVKSVQRGIVKQQTPPSGAIGGGLSTNVANEAPYIDIPINSVNTNKSIVILQTINFTDSHSYIGEFTSSNSLRVFYRSASGTSTTLMNAFGWQVVEFY